MGESSIIRVITIASLARSLGMLMLCVMSVMNQSTLIAEKTILGGATGGN